jgi:uncharacterized protein
LNNDSIRSIHIKPSAKRRAETSRRSRSGAMQWRQIDRQPRSYALIFDQGDEVAKGLKDFATEQNLADASFKAIGALAEVKLAWFNPQTKTYQTCVDLKEQVELLSMIGDVAQHDGRPIVHAHVVVGRSDGTTAGGHLLEAHVRPTCEVFLTESPEQLSKAFDPNSGLLLIKL